jgi:hypothetical protein
VAHVANLDCGAGHGRRGYSHSERRVEAGHAVVPKPTKAALPLPITSDVTGLAPVCLLNGQEERVDVALQSESILA